VINMKLLIIIIYIIVSCWGCTVLDKKYKLVVRFQDKKNDGFKRKLNFISVVSFISLFLIHFLGKYLNYWDIYIDIEYLQIIVSFALVLRIYISERISEINKVKTEGLESTKDEITFCYYCGSDLNGTNICPSCGKEIEL